MTQETHHTIRLARTLIDHAGDHKEVAHSIDMRPEDSLNWQHMLTALEASTLLHRQHALIVQMAHVFEGEHFEHDDQRKAIADCTQYLKAKP